MLVLASTLLVGCASESTSGEESAALASFRAEMSAEAEAQDAEIAQLERAGFTNLNTSGTVYSKFLDQGDANYTDCGYSRGVCSVIEVVAINGCSSLYVEANIENSNGVVIDWANDSVQNLGAGDHAVMHFTSFESGAARIQMSEVNCR